MTFREFIQMQEDGPLQGVGKAATMPAKPQTKPVSQQAVAPQGKPGQLPKSIFNPSDFLKGLTPIPAGYMAGGTVMTNNAPGSPLSPKGFGDPIKTDAMKAQQAAAGAGASKNPLDQQIAPMKPPKIGQ